MKTIYTDGGCFPNPGRGGWAWAESKKVYDTGNKKHTTNNQMELMAIIEAIKFQKERNPNVQLLIFSDSKYCVNGFTYWMHTWKRNNWKKPGGIKNLNLWQQLYNLQENVNLRWVRGHNGNEMNEFVDSLCSIEVGIS